jgi:hypothetical protein
MLTTFPHSLKSLFRIFEREPMGDQFLRINLSTRHQVNSSAIAACCISDGASNGQIANAGRGDWEGNILDKKSA